MEFEEWYFDQKVPIAYMLSKGNIEELLKEAYNVGYYEGNNDGWETGFERGEACALG